MNLLKNNFGEKISRKNLYNIYQVYFEFRTFKVNNKIIHTTINEELIYHSYEMIYLVFYYTNISSALGHINKECVKYEDKGEKDTKEIKSLEKFFKENDINYIKKLKNYLINEVWLK